MWHILRIALLFHAKLCTIYTACTGQNAVQATQNRFEMLKEFLTESVYAFLA
jgi:hypothetical protein